METELVGTVRMGLSIEGGDWPAEAELRDLAQRAVGAAYGAALADGVAPRSDYEVSLVFTDDAAIRALNRAWRGKDQPTNVLSFPQTGPQPGLLGDIVLGYQTVQREAALEHKPHDHHIAHLIVHGFLHLVGYDHDIPEDAELMEQLERCGLANIGIADPYAAAAMNHD